MYFIKGNHSFRGFLVNKLVPLDNTNFEFIDF